MEKKKTFKEFVKENEQKIKIAAALTVGCVVGAGAVYYGARDSIKLDRILKEYGPSSSDGRKLNERIYEYAVGSKGVFWAVNGSDTTRTFNELGEMIENIKADADSLGRLNNKIKGVLVFEKK